MMTDVKIPDAEEDAVFFLCALIETLGRMTRQRRSLVVETLGEERLGRILRTASLEEVCELEKISSRVIRETGLRPGRFDNVRDCRYRVPGVFEMAKLDMRLVLAVAEAGGLELPEAVMQVYGSPLGDALDDYNALNYGKSPEELLELYWDGEA